MRGSGNATLNDRKRAIEPQRNPVVGDQLEIFLAEKRASTERNYVRPATLHGANKVMQNVGFNPAKGWLSALVKNRRDGRAFAALDLLIEVHEIPAQFVGERTPDRGFAAAHESGQINAGCPFEFENHCGRTTNGPARK